MSKIRNTEISSSISSLTGECAAEKINFFAVLVYEHVYMIWSY